MPAGHFLRQLERMINWGVFSARLIELYVGHRELGRPPYDPVMLVNDSLAAKCFLGLAVDEPAPTCCHTDKVKYRSQTEFFNVLL